MLHLEHSFSPLPHAFFINKQKRNSSSLSNLGLHYDLLLLLKLRNIRNRRNGAMEKDSEFEVDSDKAREALRKLDQQFESLSNKQTNQPKIRAVNFDQTSPRMSGGTKEISGSFLGFLASALLVFSIFYNVLFITVIKPSIDGQETVSASKGTQEGEAPAKQLLTSRKFPVGM